MTMTDTRGQELATQQPAALAIRRGQNFWDDKQRAALAVLGIKSASNGELAVFFHYCQRTGLDPFSRQIYMIARREKQDGQWVEKQTIQVGIDGFRVIRDRIADRAGLDVEYEDTIWYDADGQPHDVWLSPEPPVACRVVVIKGGRRFPGVVRTAAYAAVNKDGEMVAQWRTQPDHMIEKCAEAFALRRAFPNDLGGLYIDDEMQPSPGLQVVESRRLSAADLPARAQAAETGAGGVEGSPPAPATVPGPAETAARGGSGETSVSPAGPGADPAQAASPASVTQEKRRPLSKTLLGNVKGAMIGLPLGSHKDAYDAVSALIGRQVATTEELRPEEAEQLLKVIDAELEAAQGDTEQAAEGIWVRVKALLGAEGVPDDGV